MPMDLESLLVSALSAQGYTVARSTVLQGRSGASYTISLTASRSDDRFLVDVLTARPVAHRDVQALQEIVGDVGLAGAVLLALKGVTEEVRYAPPPSNVEVWDRATLERAIGASMLERALAAPPPPGPEPVTPAAPAPPLAAPAPPSITFTPAAAASSPSPLPSPSSASAEGDAEILPGRRTPAPAPARAPSPAPAAAPAAVAERRLAPTKAEEDAEILPGRRAHQPVSSPPAPPKPIVSTEAIPGRAPTTTEDAEVLPGRRAPTAASPPRAAPEAGRVLQPQRASGDGEGVWLPPKPKAAPAPPHAAPAPPAPATPPAPAGPPRSLHSGFLSGRCLPLRIGETDARRMSERIVALVRSAELQLMPFHVFAYHCVLEGPGHSREASGLLWVSSANGAVLEAPTGDLVEDVGVPFTRLKADVAQDAAEQRARTYLTENLVVREAVRKDFGETAILERVTLKPRPGSVHVEPLGTAHAPRWKIDGLDRTVFVDASTGEVIRA